MSALGHFLSVPQIPMQRVLPHLPTPPGHPHPTGPLPGAGGVPPAPDGAPMFGQAPDPLMVNTPQLVAQLLQRLALQAGPPPGGAPQLPPAAPPGMSAQSGNPLAALLGGVRTG